MTEEELKAEFAKLLLKTPNDPFKAALLLFPDNTSRALRVANEWPADPEVMAAQAELLEEDGELAYLPTKADFARKIWDKMDEERLAPEDFAKLGKLYADVRGFIEKPQTNINTNVNNVTNRVMVVRESQSDADWEAKLRKQQEDLTNASTRH